MVKDFAAVFGVALDRHRQSGEAWCVFEVFLPYYFASFVHDCCTFFHGVKTHKFLSNKSLYVCSLVVTLLFSYILCVMQIFKTVNLFATNNYSIKLKCMHTNIVCNV